jgi:uncharacterized Zn finger protein (UPF0148 family)
VIILGDPPPDGKICCPTCGTDFVYTLRREASSGGDDRDRKTPKTGR